MTYNVHGFVGTDHVYDPERLARVIESGKPDIVALQEVDFGRGERGEPAAWERLAERLQMRGHFTLTREGRRGWFGNAVLTPHRFKLVAEGMLPARADEARAVQWLKVIASGWSLELMNTHLSVKARDRRAQVRALLGAEWLVRATTGTPLVVCGDLNCSPLSSAYRLLSRDLRDVQRGGAKPCGTWPSAWPVLRIDHMFVSDDIGVERFSVEQTGLARVASDHLPLMAVLEIPTTVAVGPVQEKDV